MSAPPDSSRSVSAAEQAARPPSSRPRARPSPTCIPRVLEAHHGGVALLVLTADRPPWLQDVGANQTIDQRTVFGPALRLFHEFEAPTGEPRNASWRSMVCRAVAAASGRGSAVPGPVQLNVPLADPLLPEPSDVHADELPETLAGRGGPWTRIVVDADAASVPPPGDGERVLFLADLTHPWAAGVAAAGHLVISEAGGAAGALVLASGVHLIGCRAFLKEASPHRVIVLGRPTLFRAVTALLADPASPWTSSRRRADSPTRAATPATVAPALPDISGLPDRLWAARWRDADAAAGVAVRKVLQDLDIGHSPRLAADLVAALPAGATLVLGSSQVPRDVGVASAARDGLRIIANRGVAGIDGTVSTAVGVALADSSGAPAVALIGDLTFLHDITGLVIGPHEPRPDLVIVVSNNDGGAIFGTLEPGRAEYAGAFERVFGTPHGVTLAGIVEAVGAEHVLVDDVGRARRRTRRPGRHPDRRGANRPRRSRCDPAGAQRRGGGRRSDRPVGVTRRSPWGRAAGRLSHPGDGFSGGRRSPD